MTTPLETAASPALSDAEQRRAAPAGIWLLLLPLLVDSAGFLTFLLTRNPALYRAVVNSSDALFIALLLATARVSVAAVRSRGFAKALYGPAALALVPMIAQLSMGTGNAVYMGAFLRYVAWVSVLLVFRDREAGSGGEEIRSGQIKAAIAIIAGLCLAQLALHPMLVDSLAGVHEAILGDGKTDAVLTNIALEKTFASLTLRNPIEVSFIGLALLVLSMAARLPLAWSLAALVIVAAGRSNTSLLVGAVVLLKDRVGGVSLSRAQRIAAVAVLTVGIVYFLKYFPEIYIGPEATYDDLILTLSYQRLGMLVAAPALAASMTVRELALGLSQPLEDAVVQLFGVGLLPEIFGDGGFMAVFDIVWIGMLIVGGVGFALAGLAFLRAMWRACRGGDPASPDVRACGSFLLVMVALSLVSQVFLSRYAMYFASFFVARALGTWPRGDR